jgi:hypothetical protein
VGLSARTVSSHSPGSLQARARLANLSVARLRAVTPLRAQAQRCWPHGRQHLERTLVAPPALAGAESPVPIARRRRPVTLLDLSISVPALTTSRLKASNARSSRSLRFSIAGLSVVQRLRDTLVAPPALAGAESPVPIARTRRPVTGLDLSMLVGASQPLGRGLRTLAPRGACRSALQAFRSYNASETLSWLHRLSLVPNRPCRLLEHVARARASISRCSWVPPNLSVEGFERSLLAELVVQHCRPFGRTKPPRHSRASTGSRWCRVARADCSNTSPGHAVACLP